MFTTVSKKNIMELFQSKADFYWKTKNFIRY